MVKCARDRQLTLAEGHDGRVPNLDYINSVVHIARWAGGSEAGIHTAGVSDGSLRGRTDAASSLFVHSVRQPLLRPGPEAAFLSLGADSLALFAVPDEGPHGFYSLGKHVDCSAWC